MTTHVPVLCDPGMITVYLGFILSNIDRAEDYTLVSDFHTRLSNLPRLGRWPQAPPQIFSWQLRNLVFYL